MNNYPQLKRKFYLQDYPTAMRIAKVVSSGDGSMNWDQYKYYMSRYEAARKRRELKGAQRELVFGETTAAPVVPRLSDRSRQARSVRRTRNAQTRLAL
jgi:hypothetical protein